MIRNKTRRHLVPPKLNLTAMVDVFTVLLVFLLKSYTTEGMLTPPIPVNLPLSSAVTAPRRDLVITVTEKEIFLDRTRVEGLSMTDPAARTLPALKTAIESWARNNGDTLKEKKVIIAGDRKIPFSRLKQIIATCAGEGYADISLAVYQKGSDS